MATEPKVATCRPNKPLEGEARHMADEPTHMKTYDSLNRSRVAHLVGEGMPDKDIAAMLGISIQRVEQLRRQYLGFEINFP